MANELTYTVDARFRKGNVDMSLGMANKQLNVTGSKATRLVQNISLSPGETISKGDIGTIGWIAIQNLDTTNFVTAAITLKIKPGEWAFVPLHTATAPTIIADTATVDVEALLIEE